VDEQRLEPTVLEIDVGVDEGNQGRGHLGQPGVASGRGTSIVGQVNGAPTRESHQRRVAPIIDDDPLSVIPRRRRHGIERRHDDRDVGRGEG
jgi:hypothetical protein